MSTSEEEPKKKSTAEEEVRVLSMRVMVNKEKTKVLCAELDANLADILLSFLTLPLGRIVHLLKKHYGDDDAPNIGSLNTLYNGLENLDSSHFWTERGKLMLLNPKSTLQEECCKLKINLNDTQPNKYYNCGDIVFCTDRQDVVGLYYNTATCFCGRLINSEIKVDWINYDTGHDPFYVDDVDEEVFTAKTTSLLVTDDLRMWPNVDKSIIQSIKDLGLMDADGAKQMIVTIGYNEIMEMLKLSLLSKTPLTDLIFRKTQRYQHQYYPKAKFEQSSLPPEMNEGENSSSKKMKVKATLHKSTNKLLFVQAGEDFIDFLFSFLTIPLGKVESLLDSSTSFGSIDNLCKGIVDLNAKFLKAGDIKYKLLNPQLPPEYLSKNQILSLTEQKLPDLYYHSNPREHLSPYRSPGGMLPVWYVDPKGLKGSYVKGPRLYMVTDDLTVRPLCMLSTLAILDELNIGISDVEEVELDIGLEEGLSILKASLTSTSALTDALIKFSSYKHPKQEE